MVIQGKTGLFKICLAKMNFFFYNILEFATQSLFIIFSISCLFPAIQTMSPS